MYYLCVSEEERAHKHGVFSSFFGQKYGIFTSEIEKNTSEIFLFLGGINFFLGQVVEFLAEVMRLKVKRYLFLWGSFLTFQGSTQVVFLKGNIPQVARSPVTYGKTKTKINPLKRLGASPWC